MLSIFSTSANTIPIKAEVFETDIWPSIGNEATFVVKISFSVVVDSFITKIIYNN